MLREIFGIEKEDVAGDSRKFHNEKLYVGAHYNIVLG